MQKVFKLWGQGGVERLDMVLTDLVSAERVLQHDVAEC